MNVVDLLLVLAIIVYAVSGYRQGFLVGSASTLGLLLGGFLGVRVTPWLLEGFDPGISVTIAALVIVLTASFAGQALGAMVGSRLRNRVRWRPARVVDALSGAALSVAAMLLIAWVLGVAASGAQLRTLSQEVRESVVLGAVDQALPGGSDRVLSAFNSLVGSSRFPSYLEPFSPEQIKGVPRPTAAVLSRPGVVDAQHSVVKILGDSAACDRSLEGSGFVYAPGYVMTNAHVVAGVDDPVVLVGDTRVSATVVYYDPNVDVAVLSVPDLQASPLDFDTATSSGDAAALLGYPENGPYVATAARIRDEQTLRSPNIYGDASVYRETVSIYADVRPGNSGGPLVSPTGDVLGVIFAASVTDGRTGYALSADQVSRAASQGQASTTAVDTGDCAV